MSAIPHYLENWSITFNPLTPKLSSTRSGSIPHIVGLLTWFSTPPRRCSPFFCRWDLMVASHAHRCCLTRPRGLTGDQPRPSTHKQEVSSSVGLRSSWNAHIATRHRCLQLKQHLSHSHSSHPSPSLRTCPRRMYPRSSIPIPCLAHVTT